MGIAYERKEQFRSSVLVRIAQPIDIDELLEQHNGDSRQARHALTAELETRMKQVVGTLYHIIPFVLVRRIASRMDQPGRLTISTHRWLVGVPTYLLWCAAVTLGLMFYEPRIAWTSLIAAPFSGLVAVYYWRRARRTIVLLYQESRLLFGLTELKKLHQQKSELQQRLGELADDYAQIVSRPLNGMPNSR